MSPEETRAEALRAAVAMASNGERLPSIVARAARLAEWIETGELPRPAPGQMD